MLGRVNSAFFVTRDVVFLVGMSAAGLADLLNVRVLMLIAALLLVGCGLLALRMPGLRQSRAEWRQALSMLRSAAAAPGLGLGRAAVPADIDRLIGLLPALGGLSAEARREIAKAARVYDAPAGTAIVRHGDTSDAAYFILDGRTVAGREEGGEYRSLEELTAGAFFGEIAALTGVPRTADVVAEAADNAAAATRGNASPDDQRSTDPSALHVTDDHAHAAHADDRSAARRRRRPGIVARSAHDGTTAGRGIKQRNRAVVRRPSGERAHGRAPFRIRAPNPATYLSCSTAMALLFDRCCDRPGAWQRYAPQVRAGDGSKTRPAPRPRP